MRKFSFYYLSLSDIALGFIGALILIFIGSTVLTAQEPQNLPPHPVYLKFTSQDKAQNGKPKNVARFVIEIADEPKERQVGLMHRTDLPKSSGMLFIFEFEREISMWMENTPLSLDMVFLDNSGRIVNIAYGTKPYSRSIISSGQAVRYVLELNAGIAANAGLAIGDVAAHPVIRETGN